MIIFEFPLALVTHLVLRQILTETSNDSYDIQYKIFYHIPWQKYISNECKTTWIEYKSMISEQKELRTNIKSSFMRRIRLHPFFTNKIKFQFMFNHRTNKQKTKHTQQLLSSSSTCHIIQQKQEKQKIPKLAVNILGQHIEK